MSKKDVWNGLAEAICHKCGSNQWIITKRLVAATKNDALIQETMCHSGYGWELGSFEHKCAKCGSTKLKVKWRGTNSD